MDEYDNGAYTDGEEQQEEDDFEEEDRYHAGYKEQDSYQYRQAATHADAPPPSSSGRRHGNISSKGWAGAVVWAKSSRHPWWPAIVLSDSQVPNNEDPPRLGAIPVRLFGNRDFMWMESQRAVSAFDVEQHERSTATKLPVFQQAMAEALHYQRTGQLPQGFNYVEEAGPKVKGRKKQDSQKQAHSKAAPQPRITAKARSSAAEALHSVAPVLTKPKTKPRSRSVLKAPSTPVAHTAAATSTQVFQSVPVTKEQRRLNILRHLALIPPVGSPYEVQPVINPNLSAKFKSFIPIVNTKRLRISASKNVMPAEDSPEE